MPEGWKEKLIKTQEGGETIQKEASPKEPITTKPADRDPPNRRGLLILLGLGIAVLLIAFAWILPRSQIHEVHRRYGTLKNKVKRLEAEVNEMDRRLAELSTERQDVEDLSTRIDELGASVDTRIEKISRQIDNLQGIMIQPRKETPAGEVRTRPTGRRDASYHEVREGETLYRIATRYGLTVEDLQRMNALGTRTTIYPGQTLILELKKEGG